MENVLGPCRLPYELVNESNKTINKGHLLSPRDLCGIEYLPRLIEAGIDCLKVEGRLKSPEYVATITRIYRKYLNLALEGKEVNLSNTDKLQLMQVFNRGGFSEGHLPSSPNKDLIYKQKPNHMGLPLGSIISYNPKKGYIKLKLENTISIGDSIQVEKENNNYNVSELMTGKSNSQQPYLNIKHANIGDIVEIGRLKGNISIGDKVFKTVDKELNIKAKKTFSGTEYIKIPIHGKITVKKDSPILLNVSCDFGIYKGANFELKADITPVLATNSPISEERIISQLHKTGNTQFEFTDIDVILEDNLFIPNISCLNDLRRNAITKLEEYAKSKYKKAEKDINVFIGTHDCSRAYRLYSTTILHFIK